ncbi:MAG: peptidoglycan-binding domain-containing protein [Candidatus Omnitrophota bacterium]
MRRHVLMGALFVIFSAGCVTSQGSRDVKIQELQNRVNYLELETQRKDKEIERLTAGSGKGEYVTLDLNEDAKAPPQMTVVNIQTALNNAGFYEGAIDGKMGPNTKRAVRDFQRANGLEPDGVVGSRTWNVLVKHL